MIRTDVALVSLCLIAVLALSSCTSSPTSTVLPGTTARYPNHDILIAIKSVSIPAPQYVSIDFALNASPQVDKSCISWVALAFASQEFANHLIAYDAEFQPVPFGTAYNGKDVLVSDTEVVNVYRLWPKPIAAGKQGPTMQYSVRVVFQANVDLVKYVRISEAANLFLKRVLDGQECRDAHEVSVATDWHMLK